MIFLFLLQKVNVMHTTDMEMSECHTQVSKIKSITGCIHSCEDVTDTIYGQRYLFSSCFPPPFYFINITVPL